MKPFIHYCIVACILPGLMGSMVNAREIIDMAGRKVSIPETINKIYAPSPYGALMLYSVAPEKLAGLMFPIKAEDKKYLDPVVYHLPVIGRINNTQAILDASPDLLVIWTDTSHPIHQKSENLMQCMNLPYVYVGATDLADLHDYPACYEFLGKLLGKEEHTSRQSAYCRKVLDKVEKVVRTIPKEKRPKVYLAEGEDGLCTECDESLHVHLFRLAGDVNVHRCHTSCHKGLEKVSLDQVKAYDPDVIFVQNKTFFGNVYQNPEWREIEAVRNNRVYLIPPTPFNWFDRPPSFMRILGLQWVMTCVYPGEYGTDIVQEGVEFFKLFLHVTVSPEDIRRIVSQ